MTGHTNKLNFIDRELERRIQSRQFRQLRNVVPVNGVEIRINEKNLLNFCSNDYLGLSMHPLLKERAVEFVKKYGTGSTASRLICGNYDFYEKVESRLAQLKQTPAALVLSSGFQANITVIPAIADSHSLILSDRLNHNSLIHGCRLARSRVVVYRHRDMDHLEQLLSENAGKGFSKILIVTESVFSMDGDIADLATLVALADRFNAFLIVDDAHATGVFGHQGMGLTCGHEIDLVIGTFGKAGGSFGAYLACSEKIRDYMVNCCAGLIYTTALPPAVMGAIDAALDIIPEMDAQRASLLHNAAYLRRSLHEMGFHTGDSSTQIIPVMAGEEADALELSGWLEENGILISAIRPPTVPDGESRIRLSLSALHTKAHIDRLIKVLQAWRSR